MRILIVLNNWQKDIHFNKIDSGSLLDGFSGWGTKDGHYSGMPPVAIMANICTMRIHLDDTDEHNGALKVLPGTHAQGIVRPDHHSSLYGEAVSVSVPAGGVMLMKPLLLHASGKNTNEMNRRVIHIELSNMELPAGLEWNERAILF